MASTREWFETVEEARRRARRRLPRSVYMALVAGAEKGVTLQDNLAAFSELRFAPPRIANLPAARDLGSPAIPEKMDLRAVVRFAPEGIVRPAYVRDWLRHGGLPDLTVPNMSAPGEPAPTFFGVYGEWMQTPPPTWDDIAWLREQW